jgi:DNA sulfur modification protein DndD
MFIQAIRLKNFQCYYEENEIKLSEGLNLIIGANNHGKSKLYDAFYWVLEDKIIYENQPTYTALVRDKLVNDKAKAECPDGESVETYVELEVEHTNQEIYLIRRTYQFAKNSSGEPIILDKSKTDISKKDILSFKPYDGSFDDLVGKILPTDIRPYVWFQGEQGVSNLINTTDEKSLQEVIQQLSNIQRWEIFKTIGEKIRDTATKKYNSVIKQNSTDEKRIDELESQKSSLLKEIDKLKNYIVSDEENLSLAQDKQEQYINKIKDAELAKSLRDKKKSISQQLTATEKKYNQFTNAFTSQIFDQSWVLIGLDNYIDEFGKKIKDYEYDKRKLEEQATGKETKFRLPAHIPDPIKLQEMLDEEKCFVCNQPIEQHSDAYHFIIEKMKQEKDKASEVLKKLNNHSDFFDRLRRNSLGATSELTSIHENIPKYKEEELRLKKEVEDFKEEYDKVDNQLERLIQNIGDDENNILSTYNEEKRRESKSHRDLGMNTVNLENLEKDLLLTQDELNKLTINNEDTRVASELKSFVEDIANIALNSKSRVYNNLIDILEDKANVHFQNINNLAGGFVGKIKFEKLGRGYKPKIINHLGEDIHNINASNTSAMKLSIILAIISTKEENTDYYPLITDAPVSDFDVLKVPALLNEIGQTFKQSVVILKDLLRRQNNDYVIDNDLIDSLRELPGFNVNIYKLEIVNTNNGEINDRSKIYTKVIKL